jgi:hypothetical protein
LEKQDVVILADVPQLTGPQTEALKTFVSQGGGLLMMLGDGVDADRYNAELYENGSGLLPARLNRIQTPFRDQAAASVLDASLELSWLMPFRRASDGQFYLVRFEKWWHVTPAPARESDDKGAEVSTPIVAAQLDNKQPLLITRKFGKGSVMLFTSPMDAASQWNTLGARQHTFVPLIYEMVFHLASPDTSRNVETGQPLVLQVPADLPVSDYVFVSPDQAEHAPAAQPVEDGRLFVRLNETQLPGVYTFRHKTQPPPPAAMGAEQFVVNFDRAESNLTPLSEEEQTLLESDSGTTFITGLENLMENLVDDFQRAELFRYLMVLFLVILVFEVVLTRRMVQGGHMELEVEDAAEETPDQTQPREPIKGNLVS